MAQILLAFDHIGLAVQLQESLEAKSHTVATDTNQAAGPNDSLRFFPEVVVLLGDGCVEALPEIVERWRGLDPPPGVVVMGAEEATQHRADACRALFVASRADIDQLDAAIQRAKILRFAFAMNANLALRAVGLVPAGSAQDNVVRVVSMGRDVDIEIVRGALAPHAWSYVTATKGIELLRTYRALTVPEVEFTRYLDGTHTVQTLIQQGSMDSWQAARLLWRLASAGAVLLTAEPSENTAETRNLAQVRLHLRARQHRLEHSTYYDVLELSPSAEPAEVEQAVFLLGLRYSPERLRGLDLGNLAPLAQPIWTQVLQARKTLSDWSERGRYNDWLAQTKGAWKSEWAVAELDTQGAQAAFVRGQNFLVRGEIHRAVSEMASAARMHPHHPDYEVSLAWARYRMQVSRGKDSAEVASAERVVAERALSGRRPWPRALVALGLLCMADRNPEAARWHLQEALTVDPNMPAAKQILSRIGNR